jgi:hypothetical protein
MWDDARIAIVRKVVGIKSVLIILGIPIVDPAIQPVPLHVIIQGNVRNVMMRDQVGKTQISITMDLQTVEAVIPIMHR